MRGLFDDHMKCANISSLPPLPLLPLRRLALHFHLPQSEEEGHLLLRPKDPPLQTSGCSFFVLFVGRWLRRNLFFCGLLLISLFLPGFSLFWPCAMQQRPKRGKKRAAFTFSPHLFSRVRTAALLEGRKPQKTFFSRILGFLPSPNHAFSQGTHIPILLLPLFLEASHLSVMIGSASDSDSLPLLPPHPPDDKASAA